MFFSPLYKKVFDTVRCASQNSLSSTEGVPNLNYGGSGGGFFTSSTITTGSKMTVRTQVNYSGMGQSTGSIYSSSSLGYPSLDSTGQSDNESLHTDSDEGYP